MVFSKGLKGKVRNVSILILIAGIILIFISSFLSSLVERYSRSIEFNIVFSLVEGFFERINLLSYLFIFSSVAGVVVSFFLGR